jgi:hypothetical protein
MPVTWQEGRKICSCRAASAHTAALAPHPQPWHSVVSLVSLCDGNRATIDAVGLSTTLCSWP